MIKLSFSHFSCFFWLYVMSPCLDSVINQSRNCELLINYCSAVVKKFRYTSEMLISCFEVLDFFKLLAIITIVNFMFLFAWRVFYDVITSISKSMKRHEISFYFGRWLSFNRKIIWTTWTNFNRACFCLFVLYQMSASQVWIYW